MKEIGNCPKCGERKLIIDEKVKYCQNIDCGYIEWEKSVQWDTPLRLGPPCIPKGKAVFLRRVKNLEGEEELAGLRSQSQLGQS